MNTLPPKVMSRQLDALRDLARNPELLQRRVEKISAWSVGEQLSHVVIVCEQVCNVFDHLENAEEIETRRVRLPWFWVRLTGRIPRHSAESPASMLPDETVSPEDLAQRIDAFARRIRETEDRVDRLQAVGRTFPHPVFGGLTPQRWMRFLTIHTDHHLRIVRDILRKS